MTVQANDPHLIKRRVGTENRIFVTRQVPLLVTLKHAYQYFLILITNLTVTKRLIYIL